MVRTYHEWLDYSNESPRWWNSSYNWWGWRSRHHHRHHHHHRWNWDYDDDYYWN